MLMATMVVAVFSLEFHLAGTIPLQKKSGNHKYMV
jgi:hypothetical protein